MHFPYRFDPYAEPSAPPATPQEAAERLRAGNEAFTGTSPPSEKIVRQRPFAIVLGCSDARVPTEIVFNQPRNDLFIVRVAGNVLGSECLGSIEYAATHLADNLRLVVVLGHGSCGAVTSAVDAYLDPAGYPEIAASQALRAIIDRIFVSVRAASRTLQDLCGPEVVEREGYREALIDVTVGLNAAFTAWTLRGELAPAVRERVGVAFGVFDLRTHRVWTPSADGSEISPGLAVAPTDRESLRSLERGLGSSERVRMLLEV